MGIILEPPSDGFEVGQRVYWHQDLTDPDDDGFREAVVRAVHRAPTGRVLICQIVPTGGTAPGSPEVAAIHRTPNPKLDCRSCAQRGWLRTI
ncbi:MAG TPA: hypothetical protein VGM10_22590 [Actinocrinis sp.]